MEVEGGEGTRFLRVRSKGTETPSKDGQSWRWKESRSCWESKRPDGLAKVGSSSEPDEKGGARGWWECGMKPARGDGDVADGEGGQLVCGGATAGHLAASSCPPPLGQYLSAGNT